MIGNVAARAGDPANVAHVVTDFLMTLREVILRQPSDSGGNTQIWKQQDERVIRSAVTILAFAGEELNARNISRLIVSAPQTLEAVRSEWFRNGYCNKCLQRAFAAIAQSPLGRNDLENAGNYFIDEWPALAKETRGSILLGTMSSLDVLNSGLAGRLFGSHSTFSISEAMDSRRIVLVNMPPDIYGTLGLVASAGLKTLWQEEVLRREVTASTPISVIVGDEASLFFTKPDAPIYRGAAHR